MFKKVILDFSNNHEIDIIFKKKLFSILKYDVKIRFPEDSSIYSGSLAKSFFSHLGILSETAKAFFSICIRIFLSDEIFFRWFLKEYKILGIDIGDGVCSLYLRSGRSQGRICKDLYFFYILLKSLYSLFRFNFFLQKLLKLYGKNINFYSIETSYFPELQRRLCLKFGLKEIRYMQFEGKVREISLTGPEIRRKNTGWDEYKKVSDMEIDLAKKKIESLVNRIETYHYMQNDVNINEKIIYKDSLTTDKKTIAIYLHDVSDAQYFFGFDGYLDLDNWLHETISLIADEGYYGVIKMHPNFFRKDIENQSNTNWLKLIGKKYGFEPTKFNNKQLTELSENLAVCGTKVSIIDLVDTFEDLCVITHHGSIALESSYLGCPTLVSTASPYNKTTDDFLLFYSDRESMKEALNVAGGKYEIKRSLFEYVFKNFFVRRELPMAYYFESVKYFNHDSMANFDSLLNEIKQRNDKSYIKDLEEKIIKTL